MHVGGVCDCYTLKSMRAVCKSPLLRVVLPKEPSDIPLLPAVPPLHRPIRQRSTYTTIVYERCRSTIKERRSHIPLTIALGYPDAPARPKKNHASPHHWLRCSEVRSIHEDNIFPDPVFSQTLFLTLASPTEECTVSLVTGLVRERELSAAFLKLWLHPKVMQVGQEQPSMNIPRMLIPYYVSTCGSESKWYNNEHCVTFSSDTAGTALTTTQC